MANQVEVTVYSINGMPQTEAFVMSFLTSGIMVQEYTDVNNPSVNSSLTYYPVTNDKQKKQVFLVGETVDAILTAANNGGTTQVQATVYSENESPYKEPQKTNFPANGISIWPVANSLPVQSFIEYKNNKYQVSESEATLLANSNTVYSAYKVYTALLTQIGGDGPQYLNFDDYPGGPPLTIGVTYEILGIDGNPDFTNVGAPNNNIGTSFVATGTTPNSWGQAVLLWNTGAPVVTVLENTIGNVYWTYVDVGNYIGHLNNGFPTGKVFYTPNLLIGASDEPTRLTTYFYNENEVYLNTSDGAGGNLNNVLVNTPIEIRVYN